MNVSFALPGVVVHSSNRGKFVQNRDGRMTTFRAAQVNSFLNSRTAGRVGLILAGLMSAFYATWFAQRPLYNWDIIPYVAIALLDAGHPTESLRQKTYEIIERSTPTHAHEFLLGGSEYKKDTYNRGADYRYTVAHDSKVFADQLPLYTVKPAYPALMSLLVRFGVNPVTATMVVSGAGYAAICFLLYAWISRWINPAISLVLVGLLSLNPVLIPLAQLATPDSLSTFVLLLGTFLAIEIGYPALGVAIFVVSILVRPENIIYLFIFLVFLAATKRLSIVLGAIAFALAFALYFVETRLSHNYGWRVLFDFTFFDWTILQHPADTPFGLFDYVNVYVKELFRMFFTRGVAFPSFLLIGIAIFLMRYHSPQLWHEPYVQLALVALLYIVARTAVLPGEPDRALVFPYTLLAICFIRACYLCRMRATDSKR